MITLIFDNNQPANRNRTIKASFIHSFLIYKSIVQFIFSCCCCKNSDEDVNDSY